MRLEYKYLIDFSVVDEFKRRLAPFVKDDSYFNGDNLYTVRSIYFDTKKMKYYYEKIDGIRKRKKLRIRGYNEESENDIIFLEIKRKYENYVKKNRSSIELKSLTNLLESKDIEANICTENGKQTSIDDAERFLHHLHKRSLSPVVLVVYDRLAFYSKFDDSLRITFDENLRYKIFPELNNLYDEDLIYSLPGKSILEVKFSKGYPIWLQNLIREFGLFRQSISKYTICLDHEMRQDSFLKNKILSANTNYLF